MSDADKSKISNLKAIALSYDDPNTLPKVLASGEAGLAKLIIEIATSSNIPVQENKELVSLLESQKRGPVVSPKALKILSEIVAFLYHTDKQWKERHANFENSLG